MGKIQQLDEQTTNMIAAGEVVERPMGVVKELVENAIDAQSTHITISIEEGGIAKITVSDNGIGMDSQDAQMCFQRHATSKIRHENDLWAIHTLGFRGEAIPSIAAVAKVTLITSDGNDNTRIVVNYGKLESASSYPCNQGTEITVEGLFYHTPARLKHMRSASYEASLIQDVIVRFALSHPEIAFHLLNDGKDVFRTSGQGDLLEVIYNVYGQTPTENSVEVDFSDYDYHVHGYLIKPSITRASKNMMFLFLNGRMVRTYRLYKAVIDGYHGLIPDGRYPLCVLSIEMDPHLLDVNVHPSKWEVRISKEIQLEVLLKEEVHKSLNQQEIVPTVQPEVIRTTYYEPMSFDEEQLQPAPEIKEEPVIKETPIIQPRQADIQAIIQAEMEEDNRILSQLQTKIEEPEEIYEEEKPVFPQMQVIGQFRKKYILANTDGGLAIIDQAGVQKRILFEQTLTKLKEETVMQDLLVPVTLHVSHTMLNRLDDINETYQSLQIAFEPFGEDTLVVRSIPAWLQHADEQKFLQDLLDGYQEEDAMTQVQLRKDIARKLCKYMVTNTAAFSIDECTELLKQLAQCDEPFTSLSGKPLWILLEEADIQKEFK